MTDFSDVPVAADVKLDLHPSSFGKHASHPDPAIAGLTRAAQNEFTRVYERLAGVSAQVRAIHENRDLSLEARQRQSNDVRAAAKADAVSAIAKFSETLDSAVGRYQSKLNDAAGLGGEPTPTDAEVRAHVKSLPTDMARIEFLRGLAAKGDRASVAAVLRGQRFLSGLDSIGDEDFAVIRNDLLRHVAPEADAALAAVTSLREQVRRASRIVG